MRGSEAMGEEYLKELCDEKHKNIDRNVEDIKKNVNLIFIRLNWFYVIAITTLGGVLVSIFKG